MKKRLARCMACVICGVGAACVRAAVPSQSTSNPASQPIAQCGHYVVWHCCQLLGSPANIEAITKELPAKDGGHSLTELIGALEHFGLGAEGKEEDYATMTKGAFPVIAHMKGDHYVTLEKADDEFVMLLDGVGRRKLQTVAEFNRDWDGKLLRVSRMGPDGVPYPRRSDESGPRIQFESLFIDAGEVPYDQKAVEYTFKFRNCGRSDLVVRKVRTSCSCLKCEKPEQAILPGGNATIKLTYVSRQGGAFVQKAYIETNDGYIPVIELTAAGNAGRRLIIDPPVLNFGEVVLGESREISCIIHYSGDRPLAVSDVNCNVAGIRIRQHVITESLVNRLRSEGIGVSSGFSPSSVVLLLSTTATGNPATVVEGKVNIATNIEQFASVNVPVRVAVSAPVVAIPATLSFGEVDQGAKSLSQNLFAVR